MKPDNILDYPEAPEPTPSYYDTLYEKSPWYKKVLLETLRLMVTIVFLVPVLVYWLGLGVRYLYRNLTGKSSQVNDIPTSP